MEISKNIEIAGTALWLKEHSAIIINDLHLGYEETLQRKGVLLPKFQLQEIFRQLEKILQKTQAKKVIINGDLKHEFGKVLRQEWKDVLQFLDFLFQQEKEVIIIQGNHDPLLRFVSEKKGIQMVQKYAWGDTLIVHGDEIPKISAVDNEHPSAYKRIIIGHEHPAITLREGSKREKYKCFLKGKWKGKELKAKELIAVPSFNPLLEGTDVLKEKLLSPFLTDIKNFEVFVVGKEEGMYFGKVKELESKYSIGN